MGRNLRHRGLEWKAQKCLITIEFVPGLCESVWARVAQKRYMGVMRLVACVALLWPSTRRRAGCCWASQNFRVAWWVR